MNAQLAQNLTAIIGPILTTIAAAWAKNLFEGKRRNRRSTDRTGDAANHRADEINAGE